MKKEQNKSNFIFLNFDLIIDSVHDMIQQVNPPVVSLIAVKTKDPFKILISTILSARTRDEKTIEAFNRLFSEVNNAKELKELPISQIEKLIKSVGFYRNKAKYLKAVAKYVEIYGVPNTFDELIKLPGVGRKTANLVLIEAFDQDRICVDTHVHRISNRWGLVNTTTPEQTEFELMKLLPKKYWKSYNFNLVAFGQTICKARGPKCRLCQINSYCPYFKQMNNVENQ